jgi:hypothetical protein
MTDDLIEQLIERMDRRPEVRAAIRAHLEAQRGVPAGLLRLSDGRIVPEGEAAE